MITRMHERPLYCYYTLMYTYQLGQWKSIFTADLFCTTERCTPLYSVLHPKYVAYLVEY